MAVVSASAAAQPVWLETSRIQAATEAVTLTAEQGRELARLQVQEIIRKIHARARGQRLNRGLTVSLPYFDDVGLELRWRELVIIPRGRIPFVPAFVVLAAEREIDAVRRESGLCVSSRQTLILGLEQMAAAFRS